jgi:hypothetical protein
VCITTYTMVAFSGRRRWAPREWGRHSRCSCGVGACRALCSKPCLPCFPPLAQPPTRLHRHAQPRLPASVAAPRASASCSRSCRGSGASSCWTRWGGVCVCVCVCVVVVGGSRGGVFDAAVGGGGTEHPATSSGQAAPWQSAARSAACWHGCLALLMEPCAPPQPERLTRPTAAPHRPRLRPPACCGPPTPPLPP